MDVSRGKEAWYFLAFFFILAFSYFNWFGGYLFFFQEQQSLLVFSAPFIQDFLLKPGGLVDLAGKFITQFYISNIAGSFLLAAVLTLPGIILVYINKRLITGTVLSQLLMLIPSCLLLLMQSHYYHMMTYNLGFVMVLLYFLFPIFSKKKLILYISLALYPFFYYLTGAYALIFLCLYIIYVLSCKKGRQKYFLPIILLGEAFITIIICKEILFLQPLSKLINFPLPFIDDQIHKILFYALTGYVILYPLICLAAGKVRLKKLNVWPAALVMVLIILSLTTYLLVKRYNTQTARVINLEKLVFEGKWNEAIKYQEKYPSKNQIGQYFYNIALSESGQLCDRMFYGPQDFGTRSLILEWSSDHLNWGAYFFYTIGLTNEAHRWAYEEMVVYGLRSQNIKLLVKTSLINGNYRMAEKYIDILKHTIFYRNWANEYEKLVGDSSAIRLHPELEKKVMILPKDNFFIFLESPESNLPLLVDANRSNRVAFEYLMSWLLLEKNVELVVSNISMMKEMGYTSIPRHIEEAIMIYYNSTRSLPDLGGLTISHGTRARFDQYLAAYMAARQNPSTFKEKMQKGFGDTFWYYFHFK
jgi:uncharacterized membrane protein YhaH (DUF805 family)